MSESLITKEPVEENLGDGCLCVGAHSGTCGGGGGNPFPGNFKRDLEGSGKAASLSERALLWEPGWGPLLWGSGRIWGGGLRGGPAEEFGRGLIYRGPTRLWRVDKALETGVLLHRGPVKNHGGGGSVHQEL